MARIVEWQLPYTWGTGIEIDTNKVISILLREENNLIEVNSDNELYTDLQLAVNITPSSDFPVWVTVGKVLAENWWSQNGLILNWKTTSGDYARWLYWADWELYFDWGQGTWKQVYYSEEVDALFTALRWELATVAFTGDYNDLINRPAFLQLQSDWNQTDTDAPDYIKNKPTIPTVNDATLTIQKNWAGIGTFTANSSTNTSINITVPNVINNVTSTDTNNALSALQGKNLQDQIDDLKSMWRFLSLWDATTWLPISFPLSTPYNYQTWDYYLVETVWATNYRPSWTQYTGTASTTAETDELEIWDMYIYDWQIWLLQINHGKTVSFANLSWQPSDNANLASALNAKADSTSISAVGFSGDYDDLLNKPSIPAGQVQSDWNQTTTTAVDYIKNKPTIPSKTSQLTNDSWYITSSYHDSSKQDKLTTQTAYTSKWTSTKVPTITTNTLGQVTGITETSIAFPVTSVWGSTGAVWLKTINWNSILWSGNLEVSGITKVFTLSSTSDLTNAQAAYDWYANGWNPIIRYNKEEYRVSYIESTYMYFGDSYSNNNSRPYMSSIRFGISSWTVTSVNYYSANITRHSTITVTLTSAWWSSNSQTVSATGVTASNTVIVSPAPSDIADYADCGVYCSAQASGTLTFGCDTAPSGDIVVNVLIMS